MSEVYRPSRKGFKELALSPKVQAACVAKAESGMAVAKSLAQEFRDTGEYEESFEVRPVVVDSRAGTRVGARLVNTAGHAAAVEWGPGKRASDPNTGHRVLGRTLAALRRL